MQLIHDNVPAGGLATLRKTSMLLIFADTQPALFPWFDGHCWAFHSTFFSTLCISLLLGQQTGKHCGLVFGSLSTSGSYWTIPQDKHFHHQKMAKDHEKDTFLKKYIDSPIGRNRDLICPRRLHHSLLFDSCDSIRKPPCTVYSIWGGTQMTVKYTEWEKCFA